MKGTVTSLNEALIKLRVRGGIGAESISDYVLDTGFTDYLTIRPADAVKLGTHYDHSLQYTLADGSIANLDIHTLDVLWYGIWRTVLATVVDTDPLLGMALLRGFRLTMDIVDGGIVEIVSIP